MDEQLRQVDDTRPFVFVSYASPDKTQVFADMLRLQNAGLNFWIDTELAYYTGNTWKEVVRHNMRNRNCKAVLCFVSKFSLMSSAVRFELDTANSQEIKGTHYGKSLPIIPIQVTPFEKITEFCYEIAAECTETRAEAELPGEGEIRPSDNVIYLQNKYFNNDDILHYCIFNNRDICGFVDSLKSRYGVVFEELINNKFVFKNNKNELMKSGKRYKDAKDYDKSLVYYIEAAIQGEAEAYLEMGHIYGNNIHRLIDYRTAESCFQRAFDLGLHIARYDIIVLGYRGKEYRLTRSRINEIKDTALYSNKKVMRGCEDILKRMDGIL